MRTALILAALIGPGAAWANEDLPDYPTCIAIEVAHFERALERSRYAGRELDFEIVTRDGIDYCGVVGIVRCDLSDAPLPCQADLAEAQAALRAEVLASVPAPEAVAGIASAWATGFYPVMHAVAHGSSAGPDCAGTDAVYAQWCETRQASLKVAEAVMLWQAARVLGVADSAVDAGWADVPPPVPPVQRPER
jgi:hypothetical protein